MNCTAGEVLITKGTALPVDAEGGEKVMSVVRPTLFRIGTGATQLHEAKLSYMHTHTHTASYTVLVVAFGVGS